LAGKHAAPRTLGSRVGRRRAGGQRARYLVPAAAALLVGASVIGVSIGTGWGFGGFSAGDDAIALSPGPARSSPDLSDPSAEATAAGGPAGPAGDRTGNPGGTPAVSPSVGRSASAKATRTPRPAARGRTASPSPAASRAARSSPARVSGAGGGSDTCGISYYEGGSVTASGELFDRDGFTAAHRTLAFDTLVRVTNPANSWAIVVRINDRGPAVSGRCLDLTPAAFAELGPLSNGVIQAKYEILG
jgi:rare lipoprotein A